MRMISVAVAGFALVIGGVSIGCSSSDPVVGEGCVGAGSEALKTCARGATISGVDISFYQGDVNWAQIRGAGHEFGFARISDGLHSPDSKFARNWPAMKVAGVIRGSYQYFRASQDAGLQAQMVLDKLAASGGLKAGDLPPVLDLETADGLPSSVVVAKAKAWLAAIEAAIKVKPIVYTAAFMSDVIGSAFSGYTLWVANYGTTCPTMPSGWTDWQFWQNAENGGVPGVAGGVDTNFFNGTLTQLKVHTLKGGPTAAVPGSPPVDPGDHHAIPSGATPNDGSQGATMGSETPQAPNGAPLRPCR